VDWLLIVWAVVAIAVAASVAVALRRPDDRAWLQRRGWMWVLAMTVSIVAGILSRIL
jgi:hypothetical protein